MPSTECYFLGFVLSIILLVLNIWMWVCDCSDRYGCNQYLFELQCPAFNEYCEWNYDNSECTNADCMCWGTKINAGLRVILSFVFGIPMFGGWCGFAWWCIKCQQDTK